MKKKSVPVPVLQQLLGIAHKPFEFIILIRSAQGTTTTGLLLLLLLVVHRLIVHELDFQIGYFSLIVVQDLLVALDLVLGHFESGLEVKVRVGRFGYLFVQLPYEVFVFDTVLWIWKADCFESWEILLFSCSVNLLRSQLYLLRASFSCLFSFSYLSIFSLYSLCKFIASSMIGNGSICLNSPRLRPKSIEPTCQTWRLTWNIRYELVQVDERRFVEFGAFGRTV